MTRGARPLVTLLALAAAAFAPPADAGAGSYAPDVNYALHCQGCHLADGRATPGLVPPLDSTLGRMVRVPDGRAYLVRLPNVVAAQIDDQAAAALMTWVVRRFGGEALPPDFAPFTAQEIAAGRRAPLVAVGVEAERRRVLALVEAEP